MIFDRKFRNINLKNDTKLKIILILSNAFQLTKDHCFVEGSRASPIFPTGNKNQ
jgi:hypothetical protein